MKDNDLYVVVGCKPWNKRVFDEKISRYAGDWHYIDSRETLTTESLSKLNPRRIFFLHWSWKVPAALIETYECVCFHMTDVPYGRGGSPLQNLIIRGHRETKLTALRMTDSFDAGPIYLKENLSLEGSAEEIFIRATELAADMIKKINEQSLEPVPQRGSPTIFKRRNPEESQIEQCKHLYALYDFVRMLDADGYPKAFFVHNGFRYEFSRAALKDGRILADVEITKIEEDDNL